MPKTAENWLVLVKNCVCYARQTREIYQVLLYSMDSEPPGACGIYWVKHYLVIKCSLSGIKDFETAEMIAKVSPNLYVRSVNIFS